MTGRQTAPARLHALDEGRGVLVLAAADAELADLVVRRRGTEWRGIVPGGTRVVRSAFAGRERATRAENCQHTSFLPQVNRRPASSMTRLRERGRFRGVRTQSSLERGWRGISRIDSFGRAGCMYAVRRLVTLRRGQPHGREMAYWRTKRKPGRTSAQPRGRPPQTRSSPDEQQRASSGCQT